MLNTDLKDELLAYARTLPIADYHNHLSPREIKTDAPIENVTRLWLTPDPYKHRLMRALGVPEELITGAADDKTKFSTWCACFPKLIGTPVYAWGVRELRDVFGLSLLPSEETADTLWSALNEQVKTMTPRALLARFGCEKLAPCTGLTDDLSAFDGKDGLVPSLRGDTTVSLTKDECTRLGEVTGIAIRDLDSLFAAIEARIALFHSVGCRLSDHALDDGWHYVPDDQKNEARLSRVLAGETLEKDDRTALSSCLLRGLAKAYAKRGWTMQLHLGAERFTSSRLRALVGPAGGFAGIGGENPVREVIALSDDLERENALPRTILFTLNPAYNESLAILSGSFTREGVPGLVVQGPAWWWVDHEKGIRDVLETTCAYGLLWNFPGMTTDSRSFLSFVRHDYFREIFCSFVAEKVKTGLFPADTALLKTLVENVCYQNANHRFI